MARPKQIVKRTERIVARVTPLEKKAIQLGAEKSGLKESDYVRKAALNQKIKFRLNPDEIEIFKTLTEYRVNFTRIANLISQRPDLADLRDEVREVARSIEHQLKKFR